LLPLKLGFNELGADEDRKVLYRDLHLIAGVEYLVEISKSKTKVFILLFSDFKPTLLRIALPQKLAFKLIDDDYPLFITTLYVKYGKL